MSPPPSLALPSVGVVVMVVTATTELVVRTCEKVLLPLTVTIVVRICCVELETEMEVVRRTVDVESWLPPPPPRAVGDGDEDLSAVVEPGRALVLGGGGDDDRDVVGASCEGGAEDDGGGAARLDEDGGGVDAGGVAEVDGGSDDVGVLRLSDDGVVAGSLVEAGSLVVADEGLEEVRVGDAEVSVLLGVRVLGDGLLLASAELDEAAVPTSVWRRWRAWSTSTATTAAAIAMTHSTKRWRKNRDRSMTGQTDASVVEERQREQINRSEREQ